MNTNSKIKLLGAIIGILLFIAAIAGITYAWITWESVGVGVSGNTSCFYIDYKAGKKLSSKDIYLFDKSTIIKSNKILITDGMEILDVSASLDESCNITANFALELNITSVSSAYTTGNSKGALKYVLASYNPTVYTNISDLKGQSLSIIESASVTSTGKVTFDPVTLTSTPKGYLVIFYVDGDLAQNDAGEATFTATLKGIVTQTEQ